jgi:putative RecB family exonuclease
VTYYSYSRLATFEDCPLKYKFNYLDRIKREEESIEAFLGSRFHETMEKLYRELQFRVYSLEELLDYYEEQWSKNYHSHILLVKKERSIDDYKNLGRRCIKDYYQRYYPFNQGRTLALEKRVLIDLKGEGRYLIQGYIDRIDQLSDGTYEIHDYKTSANLPEQGYLDKDRQLTLYQIGVQNLWPEATKVRLIWHYVAFDKEISSQRSPEELKKLKEDTISLIEKIENTKEFLPKESALCSWCSYPDLCPRQKHYYQVEKLLVKDYLNDDGVKLVNTFANFKLEKRKYEEKIKEIDEKLEKLKEAVIKYADREGVEVIAGSDHKLKISEKQKVFLPLKNSPERKALEELLKQLHKLEEVSTLDTYALEKIIKEEGWDRSILEKIRDFYKIETAKIVSLGKRNFDNSSA